MRETTSAWNPDRPRFQRISLRPKLSHGDLLFSHSLQCFYALWNLNKGFKKVQQIPDIFPSLGLQECTSCCIPVTQIQSTVGKIVGIHPHTWPVAGSAFQRTTVSLSHLPPSPPLSGTPMSAGGIEQSRERQLTVWGFVLRTEKKSEWPAAFERSVLDAEPAGNSCSIRPMLQLSRQVWKFVFCQPALLF